MPIIRSVVLTLKQDVSFIMDISSTHKRNYRDSVESTGERYMRLPRLVLGRERQLSRKNESYAAISDKNAFFLLKSAFL